MLAMLKPLVHLDWSTNCYHVADLALLLPRDTFTNHYRREGPRHTVRILCVMLGYNGLELVVAGAVDEGDVVLTFIG